ncbi:MAG: endonuclease/exonuclease/phosphatase family protein [Planctomycetaceae bacterium]
MLTFAVLTGAVLHLTVKDSVPLLATVFYALPLPVILLLAIARLVCARILRDSRSTVIWAVVVFSVVGWTTTSLYEWHSLVASQDTIRVVCWNTGQGKGRWRPAYAEIINRLQPDIVGLIEAGGDLQATRQFFESQCPGYQVSALRGGLICLSRGTAGEGSVSTLAGGGKCGQVSLNIHGQSVELLLVDVHSSPLKFRADPLKALAEKAAQLQDRPVIILGDFNTPNDSVHLEALRTHHTHAFEAAGQGYACTWPIPLPVLNLDQIWTNAHCVPVSCHHEWTVLSDHRLVVADISILPVE